MSILVPDTAVIAQINFTSVNSLAIFNKYLRVSKICGTFSFIFLRIFMKIEAKNLSPVAFHALICVEVSVSIKCFDWSKMTAEVFPVARIDE